MHDSGVVFSIKMKMMFSKWILLETSSFFRYSGIVVAALSAGQPESIENEAAVIE